MTAPLATKTYYVKMGAPLACYDVATRDNHGIVLHLDDKTKARWDRAVEVFKQVQEEILAQCHSSVANLAKNPPV